MEVERMTYSRKALAECTQAIQSINVTVRRKNEHFAKAMEIRKVADFCYEKTGCLLFDPVHTPVEDYYRASYNFKNHTKKILDAMEMRALRYIEYELRDIVRAMRNGEVNCIA